MRQSCEFKRYRLLTLTFLARILVLKEGQIVESGSFRELLLSNGVFASMWADQVSADEEVQVPDVRGLQKEVAGYAVEDVEAKTEEPVVAKAPESTEETYPGDQDPFTDPFPTEPTGVNSSDNKITESPKAADFELSKEETEELEESAEPSPVEEISPKPESTQEHHLSYAEAAATAVVPTPDETLAPAPFPSTEDAPTPVAPIAFPSSRQPDTPPESQTPTSPVGVTFSPGTATPPSRSGTPDPEGKYKRIRKTSQNIQKFARTLSLAGRRQSSGTTGSSITKVDTNSPRTSRDEPSSSTRGPGESGSVAGDSATDRSVPVTGSEDQKDAKGKGKKGKKLVSARGSK